MKREIKFRGKRIDTGEWVYGFYWYIGSDYFIRNTEHGQSTDYEVDPETVGEFIVLKDKNGKEIYEGDIRREEIESDEGDDVHYYICVWVAEWSMFTWLHLPGEYQAYLDAGAESLDTILYWTYPAAEENNRIVICGNIHEHPDLIKR